MRDETNLYHCWLGERHETRANSETVEAESAHDAATKYLEEHVSDRSEYVWFVYVVPKPHVRIEVVERCELEEVES